LANNPPPSPAFVRKQDPAQKLGHFLFADSEIAFRNIHLVLGRKFAFDKQAVGDDA